MKYFAVARGTTGSEAGTASRSIIRSTSHMTTSQKLALIPITGALMLGGGAIAGYAGLASAQTGTQTGTATSTPWGMHAGGFGKGMGRGGVAGTISAINGTTLTVTGANGTTYTVDAASTTIDKVVQLSVSDLKVGDRVGVMGPTSGTSVTARHIMDGLPPRPGGDGRGQ